MTWDENVSYLLQLLANQWGFILQPFHFVAPTSPRPLNLLASALKVTLSSFGTYLWALHQLKYTRISSHNIPSETCYGRRHLWLIVPLSSHQQLFGRWSTLYCDRELCLRLSGESVISPICSSSLFSSTWKTPQDDGTKKSLYRSVVWKWVSVFVVFWILNTDFCFCVTTFVHVRSRLSWREKQIIDSVVPEVFRLYFVISQTGIRSTQTAEEFQECSFTCFRLMLTFIFFYSCSIDVCFLFALKSKFTLLHLCFFIVLIVSWVTPKTNQEPMALLVCAVWNQVVKNNVFVSQLTFTFHPLTPPPMWCHHAARVVWCGRTLQTLISRERPLTSAVLQVLNSRCCDAASKHTSRIWTQWIWLKGDLGFVYKLEMMFMLNL